MFLNKKKRRTSARLSNNDEIIVYSTFYILHSSLRIHSSVQFLRDIRGHVVGVGVGAETGVVAQLLG